MNSSQLSSFQQLNVNFDHGILALHEAHSTTTFPHLTIEILEQFMLSAQLEISGINKNESSYEHSHPKIQNHAQQISKLTQLLAENRELDSVINQKVQQKNNGMIEPTIQTADVRVASNNAESVPLSNLPSSFDYDIHDVSTAVNNVSETVVSESTKNHNYISNNDGKQLQQKSSSTTTQDLAATYDSHQTVEQKQEHKQQQESNPYDVHDESKTNQEGSRIDNTAASSGYDSHDPSIDSNTPAVPISSPYATHTDFTNNNINDSNNNATSSAYDSHTETVVDNSSSSYDVHDESTTTNNHQQQISSNTATSTTLQSSQSTTQTAAQGK